MAHSALTRALLATTCTVPLLLAGCKEEPIPLFDEEGAWVLLYFRLTDSDELTDFGSASRNGKFMIYYDSASKKVAAATCNDSMGDQSLTKSLCDLPKEDGGYYCRCFDYEYDETLMTWTEYVPKGQPEPPIPTDEGVAAPGQGVRISLEVYPDKSNTYRYEPLPFGVFESDGLTSEYVFQQRGAAEFDKTGCREVCGIGAAEGM